MNCTHCGTANQTAARFCNHCGSPLAPALQPLPNGAVLQGRYQILGVLGQGGMSAVYLAQHLSLDDRVAVKEMRDDLVEPADRPAAVAQFQAEGRTLARLRHPNLPRVWDYFLENGRWYLVMDYVEGQTLAQLQAASDGGPLAEQAVLAWAGQLCDVLDYLHGQSPPIVFRDLKPANVMVDACGQVKLIDFGIARLFNPAKASDTLRFGTMGYAPPEQYAGQGQTTPRSDLYALGVTMHQLLTGADPATTPFTFSPPTALNKRVSARVSTAVLRAIRLDPAERFATAGEMKQALLGSSIRAMPAGAGLSAWQKAVAVTLASLLVIATMALAGILIDRLIDGSATPTPAATIVVLAIPAMTASPTPTVMPSPAASLPPTSTPTVGPTRTGTTGPTSTPISPAPSATTSPANTPRPAGKTPIPAFPAPVLDEPAANQLYRGTWTFKWHYNGPSLGNDYAFDLRIWSKEEDDKNLPRRGATALTQATEATVNVDELEVIRQYQASQYYWAVVVVKRGNPVIVAGTWSEKRLFNWSPQDGPPEPSPEPSDEPTRTPDPCAHFSCNTTKCCGSNPDPCCAVVCPNFQCP